MGHKNTITNSHRKLQERFDRMVTGAPDSPAFMQILHLLYSDRDAEIARQIPARPTPLGKLAKRFGKEPEALREELDRLAARGLLVDFESKGETYYLLPPVVIGFFELVFMRARDGLPMKELSALFETYMTENRNFGEAVFMGETQLSRSLVREEALPADESSEILDWERAERLVATASDVGVSLCACRHKAEHLGTNCDAPMEVCLTLNDAVGHLANHGIARRISTREGVKILERCKEAGLAQTADNVKQQVGYICNCCGCCCEQMQAIRHFDMHHAIVTSNWVVAIDSESCRGCGLCVPSCPIELIEMQDRQATADAERCLGCGVCYNSCKFGAIKLVPRERRVFTPENTFERVVTMALERGRLTDLLFDDPESLSYRTLGRLFRALEKSPPARAAMAIEPLKSTFMKTLLRVSGLS